MSWYDALRYLVLAGAGWLGLVAVGSYLVRTRRISPFSSTGGLIRRVSDPWIKPVERRLYRAGQNPQHAPWWLAGSGVVGGLLVLFLSRWLYGLAISFSMAARGGFVGVLRLGLDLAYNILILAILLRVVGSWFGIDRYRWWMRPAYALTDWIIVPLRRFVPPFGMLDVTPLVAWLLLMFARMIIFSII